MYNAELKFLNFGKRWKEKTSAPNNRDDAEKNETLTIALLERLSLTQANLSLRLDGKSDRQVRQLLRDSNQQRCY